MKIQIQIQASEYYSNVNPKDATSQRDGRCLKTEQWE